MKHTGFFCQALFTVVIVFKTRTARNSPQRGHTKVKSHTAKLPHALFLLRFTHYIYKPVYANESSKYASQLANSVRPEKKGIAREIKTRGKLISKVVEIIFVCASAWQRIVVRAPPVSKNFDAICRRRR